uniref:Putative lim and calponin similarity-containing protein 1 n=1 Tax=Rhipicephalus microplus TaxID=6941 RepID=A0A6M2CYM6_RHIMP
MAGGYRYSAALDKTYMEQRWVPPSAPTTQPVRTVPIIRTAPAPSASDPLRFIKIGQAPLGKQAREQLQAYESSVRNHVQAKLDEQEEQWQTNLDEWKSRRRKASERAFQRVQDAKELFPDDRRKESEPEPTLTTSTELLSEYSTREEFIPPNKAVRPIPAARPSSKGPKPPVPPKPMAELRRKEFLPNANEACEQDNGRQGAPTEATLSVSGRKLCSHCSQPLGKFLASPLHYWRLPLTFEQPVMICRFVTIQLKAIVKNIDLFRSRIVRTILALLSVAAMDLGPLVPRLAL